MAKGNAPIKTSVRFASVPQGRKRVGLGFPVGEMVLQAYDYFTLKDIAKEKGLI